MTFWLRTGRALAVVASIRSGRTLLLLHPARLKLKEPGVHGITVSQAVGVSRTDVAYQMVLPGLRLGLSVFLEPRPIVYIYHWDGPSRSWASRREQKY